MIATGNTTMLYCPKCRRTYEDGTQRFCDNDGGRLLPAPSAQNSDSTGAGGVFSNLLGKTPIAGESDKKPNSAPRFVPLNKTEETDKKLTSFPSVGRLFQSEQFLKPKTASSAEAEDSILELEPLPPAEDSVLEFEPIRQSDETTADDFLEEAPKPVPRLIKPSEIASGTADIGNRRTNPLGREALSWENPDALLGQTVKGRYQIVEELDADDEDSLIYLADDKIVAGKRVVVRVFMNDYSVVDEGEEKIFAEERVSLSHLNHPNIAGVFDSGELPEGNIFIVSEFVEGESLAGILQHTGQFNVLRTARVIRQTSYALSEAHQNGILHRNLKPENIVLTVSEAGIEQVKLMNFGVSHGEITETNLAYKAPEEIEKGISTYASDIYALAVIAYQMLTARLPFPIETENALLKAQRQGLTLVPTNLRLDIHPLADQILERALAFSPAERYPKARDFGDAFFNALTAVAPWTNEDESEIELAEEAETNREIVVVPAIGRTNDLAEEAPVNADFHISSSAEKQTAETSEVKATEDLAWEKRSPEPPRTGSFLVGGLTILGIVALLLAAWGFSRLFLNRPSPPENVQNALNQNENPAFPGNGQTADNALPVIDGDLPPKPRQQTTPPGAQRFQNNRENLKGDLAKNFLGFEIFYPQDWTKNPTETNFLDISKRSTDDFPIEQMIITRYQSIGTMTLDRANFPKLVEKSNQDLKKSLGESFKVVSTGETTIQNGRWKVYEVKFQSSGKNEKGEDLTLWGRRLWLPLQNAGTQNGFVLTLLATSLSETVKSVDDVGVEGELANVLETFEPEQR
jgi:serine/threonine protein kinase